MDKTEVIGLTEKDKIEMSSPKGFNDIEHLKQEMGVMIHALGCLIPSGYGITIHFNNKWCLIANDNGELSTNYLVPKEGEGEEDLEHGERINLKNSGFYDLEKADG